MVRMKRWRQLAAESGLGRPFDRLFGAMAGLVALALLAGCGSSGNDGGGGGGGGGVVVDRNYDFAAVGVLPGETTRDAGRSVITGRVTDPQSQPVADIQVVLERLTEGRAATAATGRAIAAARATLIGRATTETAADGRYAFGNVVPGMYRVSVRGRSRDVTVPANEDVTVDVTNVNVNLPPSQFRWTLMIFMNADNDLEEFGIDDLNEMEMLPASDDVAIVVLMDRTRGFDASNGNWTDARRFRIQPDDDPDLVSSARLPSEGGTATAMGEIDMGSVATMQDFTAHCMANYPADHYLLDFWNHGSGWRARRTDPQHPTRGVLFDDTQGTFVRTQDLDEAMEAPDYIDLAIFDASLMQMMEVAYQIRNHTDFIVGSEESPPGIGYPYDRIFARLFSQPTMTAEALAREIVQATFDALSGTESITQSALRANRLEGLRVALDGLADTLAERNATLRDEVLAARLAAQGYGHGSSLYAGYRDLRDFTDQLLARTDDAILRIEVTNVERALDEAILIERHAGNSLSRSHGLSIFIPDAEDWRDLRTRYRQIDFAQQSRWDEWLSVLHGVN